MRHIGKHNSPVAIDIERYITLSQLIFVFISIDIYAHGGRISGARLVDMTSRPLTVTQKLL